MKLSRKIIIILIIIISSLIIIFKVNGYFNQRKKIEEFRQIAVEEEREKREEERNFINELQHKEPYVGLEEKYINDTVWGKADKKEYSHDYDAMKYDHRSIYYIWDDGGNNDFREIEVREGKIFEITISNNNGIHIID